MVTALSQSIFSSSILHQHQNRCYLCNLAAPTVKKPILRRNLDPSICIQSVSRCLPPKNSNNSLETPTEETKPQSLGKQVKYSNPGSSVRSLIRRLRNEFATGELGWEVLSPAALALAADPITSLVDTAFVGRLGSVELAAVGVSISVFNLVSKLLNVLLLNITTSFVAEEQALASESSLKSGTSSVSVLQKSIGENQNKNFLPAVSTSLALAAGIVIAEAIALSFGSGFSMNIMGFTNACTS